MSKIASLHDIIHIMKPNPKTHQTLLGRGASTNPSNRFEQVQVSFDPHDDYFEPQDLKTHTQYLSDKSRSILTRNNSPDVGFEVSINPYRGCSHGCAYCLSGDTPILMGDGNTKQLKDVRVDDEIYGTIREGSYRRYRKTKVLAHWATRKSAYRIHLADGTELIASPDHRFLTGRGWKYVTGTEQGSEHRPHLTINNKLMGVGKFSCGPIHDEEYQTGYLTGIIRGDGLLASYEYSRAGRTHGNQHQFRLALVDVQALERAEAYLQHKNIRVQKFLFQGGTNKPMQAIRTQAYRQIEEIKRLVAWPSTPTRNWQKGFLAGIFDAEGSYSQGVLRLSNTDSAIIAQTTGALKELGFRCKIEHLKPRPGKPLQAIRLLGGLSEHLRFFHVCDPSILRKRCIEGQAIKNMADLRVVGIEALGYEIVMFDITTGTEDFIANGVVSHNCYARPTHEYLGFSAGLDFESKIMVKLNAPELLRKELSKPSWKPQMVAFSGVTDIYQPVERKLELTRRCLEVFLDFRNPVAMITKNYMITRDLDLLKELSLFGCVSVAISITTLDDELRRVMEPRTPASSRRLKAVEMLANAGIPVGVMTAPIIPGLTDHEIPRLVQTAAAAGAQWVGYNIVHLPYGVKDLFVDWLERHFPQRKHKVVERIKAMRGGQLNDPRFGHRMSGEGIFAEQIGALHQAACKKAGLPKPRQKLSTEHFRVPGKAVQIRLFE